MTRIRGITEGTTHAYCSLGGRQTPGLDPERGRNRQGTLYVGEPSAALPVRKRWRFPCTACSRAAIGDWMGSSSRFLLAASGSCSRIWVNVKPRPRTEHPPHHRGTGVQPECRAAVAACIRRGGVGVLPRRPTKVLIVYYVPDIPRPSGIFEIANPIIVCSFAGMPDGEDSRILLVCYL